MPAGDNAGIVFFRDCAVMNFRLAAAALAALLSAGLLYAEETAPVAKAQVDDRPKMAYGLMMKQGEKLVFSPCRDPSYAFVEDVSTDAALTAALNSLGLDQGKRLYVELLGIFDGATLKASSVNMARVEGRCQLPGGKEESWRAAGNDPAWALVAGGEDVQLRRYGQPEVVVPYAAFRTEGKVTRYEGSKNNNRLSVRFEKTLCHDSEAKGIFAWTATVDINGQLLKGCAWAR